MDHYAAVNKAYVEFFSSDPKPVSTIVENGTDFQQTNSLIEPNMRCRPTASFEGS